MIDRMDWLSDKNRALILGGNLLELIADARASACKQGASSDDMDDHDNGAGGGGGDGVAVGGSCDGGDDGGGGGAVMEP